MAIGLGTALVGTAIAKGIGSLIGGKKAADSSKKAAQLQSQAAEKAMALNQRVYDDQTKLMAPWTQGGASAFANMQRMAAGGQQFPGGMPLGSAMAGLQANPMMLMGAGGAAGPGGMASMAPGVASVGQQLMNSGMSLGGMPLGAFRNAFPGGMPLGDAMAGGPPPMGGGDPTMPPMGGDEMGDPNMPPGMRRRNARGMPGGQNGGDMRQPWRG
jgi:hypothetical protein